MTHRPIVNLRVRHSIEAFCTESRSRIEYLIQTNNIILLDSYFNLSNKSNLIDDVTRFFDQLVVAYFWATL